MQLTADYISSVLASSCPDCNKIYIAYSGGVDSHVLLHLCASVKEIKLNVTAVYVNHGLQRDAEAWGEHCASIAQQLGVAFITACVDATAKKGESPEEGARNARYQFLQQFLEKSDVMLLAQHQDDQLETVLLQLFRGAGLQGLSGMPQTAQLGKGQMLRPLLNFSRDQIETYASRHQLHSIEDPSNQDISFNRNYLRKQVIPLLKQRWPSVAKTVSRASGHCVRAQKMIDAIVDQQFQQVFNRSEKTLCISNLSELSVYEQSQVIRKWFQTLGMRSPTEVMVEKILTQAIAVGADKQPKIQQGLFSVRRYRDVLYLLKEDELPDVTEIYNWPKQQQQLKLNHNGTVAIKEVNSGISITSWQQAKVTVAYRRGGEKIRLQGRAGNHSLKKLFQEQGVPPWLRARMPLIFFDGALAAVAGLWICADFMSQATDKCVQFSWQKP